MISWSLCPWLWPDKDPYLSPWVFARDVSAAQLPGTGVVLISVKGKAFRVCWKRKADSFIVLQFLAARCTNYIGQLWKFEPMLSAFVTLRDLTKALVIRNGPQASGFHLWRICFWVHSSLSFSPLPSPWWTVQVPCEDVLLFNFKRMNMMQRIQILNCRLSGKQPL